MLATPEGIDLCDHTETLTELLPDEHDIRVGAEQIIQVADTGYLEESSDEGEDLDGESADLSDGHGSLNSATILLKQFLIRHRLTQSTLEDLLKLLHIYSSDPDMWPATVHLFNKQFKPFRYQIEFHYYCSYCLQSLQNDKVLHCINESCKKQFTSSGGISSFIELPLELQIANLLEHKTNNCS